MTERKIHYIDVSKLSRREAQKLLDELKRAMGGDPTKRSNISDMLETIATAASFWGGFTFNL